MTLLKNGLDFCIPAYQFSYRIEYGLQPTGIMSGEVAQHGRDSGLEIPDYGENGRKGIKVVCLIEST